MTWRHWLRTRSRDERMLWRLVIGMLACGFVAGVAIDWGLHAGSGPDLLQEADAPPPGQPLPDGNGPEAAPDPLWRDVQRSAEQGQWREVWRGVWRVWPRTWAWRDVTLLAALTGACWLVFLAQAGQPRRLADARIGGLLAGAALGVASIGVTLFFIVWQEYGWGLEDSQELAAGVRYNVLGVGLREEAAKLLCGAALLPWLLRRRDELAALIAFAGVGVGFAAEENIGYLTASGGAATLGRLLTPMPFHMALTGVVGLYAYRACRWPREWALPCLGMFGAMVFAHGGYDAFLSLPALQEYSLAAMIIFVAAVRQFFHELRTLRSAATETVSLTATFLTCVTATVAATFVVLSARAGWQTAAQVLAPSLLAEALMVYLFLREMPESFVRT